MGLLNHVGVRCYGSSNINCGNAGNECFGAEHSFLSRIFPDANRFDRIVIAALETQSQQQRSVVCCGRDHIFLLRSHAYNGNQCTDE